MRSFIADYTPKQFATPAPMRQRSFSHTLPIPQQNTLNAYYLGCLFALIAEPTGKNKHERGAQWGRSWPSINGAHIPRHTHFNEKNLRILEAMNPEVYNRKGVRDVLEAFGAGNPDYPALFAPDIVSAINDAAALSKEQNLTSLQHTKLRRKLLFQYFLGNEDASIAATASPEITAPASSLVLPDSPMPVSVPDLREAIAQEQLLQNPIIAPKWAKMNTHTRKAIVHDTALKLSPRNEEQCTGWIACCTEMTSQLGRPLAGKAPSVEQVRTHFGNLYAELTADQRKAPFGRRMDYMNRFAPK